MRSENLILNSSRVSFKRKPQPRPRFGISNLLPTLSPIPSRTNSPDPRLLRDRARGLREQASQNGSNTSLRLTDTVQDNWNGSKDGNALDWNVEGPGRRVGYDDLTAIDWIFEYSKERLRLRVLISSTPGVMGYVRQLLDASHVWVVLIMTGVAVGFLAAAINIAGDWLGDIKSGYCKTGDGGGRFYLNKQFCCWGHDGL